MRRPRSPTVDLLLVFVGVYLVQTIGGIVGLGPLLFALATPVRRPWTLIISVYAHASIQHLLTNAITLAVVGLALERSTTRGRFHAFVFVTGTVAAVAELLVGAVLGTQVAVLGASGAILALYGYVLAGNPLTGGVLSRAELGRRGSALLVAGIAIGVTVLTAGPGVALVAHFTGFVLGLVAGRRRVLRVD